jgi:predicted RNase H-like HicB family nuclease
MKFHITIERDEDGRLVAECTDLPGCLSEGDTLEEAIENISEAIIGCLKSRLKTAGENFKAPTFDQKLDISIDTMGMVSLFALPESASLVPSGVEGHL